MSELKTRLQSDLTTSMKARDELRTATIRMTLSAITAEEVAGKSARQLDDADVLVVLTREAKKRREAAEAFATGGRPELAQREQAEGEVLAAYLPAAMDDAELSAVIGAAVVEAGVEPGPNAGRQMGTVMKLVQPRVAGRADGRRVSAEVRRQLTG